MSKKGSITTADYLNFDETTSKALKIIKQGKDSKLGFLVIVGINVGLRISDLKKLTFEDFEQDSINLIEGKTKKRRTIRINDNIKEALVLLKAVSLINNGPVFLAKTNKFYSVQYINRWLKTNFGMNCNKKKKLNISTHSLRKTFARKAYESATNKESVLIFLSEIFNHSSIGLTKRYLGIRQEELDDIYMSL
jgi:integrase